MPETWFKVSKYKGAQEIERRDDIVCSTGKTVTLRLKQPVPIHLTYITAWADKAGVVHFWDDVYGRDPVLASNKKKLESDLPAPI